MIQCNNSSSGRASDAHSSLCAEKRRVFRADLKLSVPYSEHGPWESGSLFHFIGPATETTKHAATVSWNHQLLTVQWSKEWSGDTSGTKSINETPKPSHNLSESLRKGCDCNARILITGSSNRLPRRFVSVDYFAGCLFRTNEANITQRETRQTAWNCQLRWVGQWKRKGSWPIPMYSGDLNILAS